MKHPDSATPFPTGNEYPEDFYRKIFEESPVAKLVYLGEDMVLSVANAAMLQIFGRSKNIIGLPILETVPELRESAILAQYQGVMRTGIAHEERESRVLIMKKGEPYWGYYDYTYKPFYNGGAQPVGVICTALDVTDRVMAQNNLKTAETRLSGAIELAQLAPWELDVESGRIQLSPRLQDWVGKKEGSVKPALEENVSKEDRARITAALESALQPGGNPTFDETYAVSHLLTGRVRMIRAQGQAAFDAAGKPLSLLGIAQDITLQHEVQRALELDVQVRTEELAAAIEELRATNEELSDANSQLQHSNEELAQYAYVASHDLQEPLRKIRIFTDMLAGKSDLSDASRTTVGKISLSAERMSLLIQDLLAFSRLLKSDRLMRPIDLNELVATVWDDYELRAEELHATLEVKGRLPIAEGVNLQLNQLFSNLLGNALKFVKPEVAPHIKIESLPADGELIAARIDQPLPQTPYFHLTIEDNGIGFDTAYNEQIFEVFKRLHGRDSFPGSGIGLALCRRVANNHHGALWADSTPGVGTIFNLLLPLRQHQTVSEFGTNFNFPQS